MKYFVTGASGFIGSNVLRYLIQLNNKVVPCSHPSYSNFWDDLTEEDFEFIHLSAYGNHYHQKDQPDLVESNILDLMVFLETLSDDPCCKKFYNVSTSSIQLPVKTLYSLSKEFGEMLVESYGDERFVNVRPYSVYGPGEADHRFIPTVIKALHSGTTIKLDENATHDWIYVDDFIKGMLDGYKMVGTGKSYTNLQIVRILESISGKKLFYTPARLREYDNENWLCPSPVPHRSIYEGLKQTYDSYTA